MFASLSKLFRTASPKTAAKVRPQLEVLENRLVPTVSVAQSGASLFIDGDNGANTVTIYRVPYYYGGGGGLFRVVGDGVGHVFKTADISHIYFYGFNGNDTFTNNTFLRSTAYGMGGNDVLTGGWGDDVLHGGEGMDFIYGRGGNDELFGGDDSSFNYLDGGDGNDKLYGGYGTDVMHGRDGHDWLFGNKGKDYLYGGAGNDVLNGGDDGVADYLNGGTGADKFQIDLFWTGVSWANRDHPADYNFWQLDTFYN
jgi:Ca2+-binding RTX toxin-like protein